MASAVYLYPWDVVGDPDAARRVADTGAAEVALAAVYHDVRAITPFHPAHRIVTYRAGALYGSGGGSPGPFELAAGELREAGLSVTAWVVVTHNESMGIRHPGRVVHNAFGDPYPWALCCANPETREYAATLTAEIASLGCVDSVELEACGWFGFDHLSQHDKTGEAGGWLFDLCWCPSCEAAFTVAGLDVAEARARVRDAIDSSAEVPPELADVIAGVRTRLAGEFMRAAVAVVNKPVQLQVGPDPLACGANPGFADADLEVVDGLIVNCTSGDLSPIARVPHPAATLLATGRGGGGLATRARSALEAGASSVRFYHAGLANAAELAAIRDTIAQL